MQNITDKAILVSLKIGMPGNSRKDKHLTAEVQSNHSLSTDAGRWNKTLYPAEAFKPLVSISGDARTFHYDNTLPWLDDGLRILPSLNYADYTKAMREFRNKFMTLSDSHFLAKLTEWTDKARAMHNGTFNEKDYLPHAKLAKKFKFKTDWQPVQSGADFRVNFSSDELAILSANMDARVTHAAQSAESDLWSRLADPLTHLSKTLADPSAKFKDSILTNLSDIVRLIPKLNLTGNRHLQDFADLVHDRLAKDITDQSASANAADALRKSPSDRNAARLAADQILAKMAPYMPVTDDL